MERKHNFSAGPGTLPVEVLEETKNELLVFGNAGASVIEISHRSPEYTEIAESARKHLRSMLSLGDDWHILFLQGGASLQFHQIPLNFLREDATADYLVTGAWAKKAIAEAGRFGTAHLAATGVDSNFTTIPDASTWDLTDGATYVHYTSNNTIFGTQYPKEPVTKSPLVCDASSDFLCRPFDVSGHSLIYAGAQKNVGPAGVTIVLLKDEFLQSRKSDIPTMLDYETHVSKLFNTPPVFAVYLVEKVLRWLDGLGGLEAMGRRNEKKATALYERIDRTAFYRGTADVESRSLMNVTFRLAQEDLEGKFIADAKENGLLALKGHRSVGGIRASIYNACTPEAVVALISFMDDFERRNG